MNENRDDDPSTSAAPSDASAATSAPVDAAEAAPIPGRRGRRRIAAVTGALLLTGAVVGAVACTAVAVADADRDPGTPSWARPEPTRDRPAATAEPGSLARTLVPYRTDDWSRGPDLGEFGSDAVLNGARTAALLKESLAGLPRSERKQLEKEIDRRPVKEMAMRSYGFNVDEHFNGVAATMSIILARMKDPAAARAVTEGRSAFLNDLDVFRDGPEIEGYEDAECFRTPSDAGDDTDLDSMYCSASVANVTVTATAEGLWPLDAESVAALFKDQLDRIVEPGESV
ncbi:hypothetical protein [Streptomyces sp. MH60]|uniref:hypothetical protein n=1 Tax=Streptomyces sp. MH60 TaxID=1940758 RepID=UPI000D469E74|nr:hypothetical protein [Streptomyces sp. MH60]PPS79749.1 hypothetical protein BZZ08_06144 [Streptomyces sp. MH60]